LFLKDFGVRGTVPECATERKFDQKIKAFQAKVHRFYTAAVFAAASAPAAAAACSLSLFI
jgi:hypothetical protein